MLGIDEKARKELSVAAEAVSHLFTAAGKEMTPLEVNLWLRAITEYGAGATLKFVEFWMEGGGQGKFRQAPTIDEFRRRVDPAFVSGIDALERLRAEVVRSGPFVSPSIGDPRLKATVVVMGGWAKVCEEMPDPSEDFRWKRFAERFAQAWVQAEGQVLRGQVMTEPLAGLAAQPAPAGLEQAPTNPRLTQ